MVKRTEKQEAATMKTVTTAPWSTVEKALSGAMVPDIVSVEV
jgi:hypothetical protein